MFVAALCSLLAQQQRLNNGFDLHRSALLLTALDRE
jgi:hypothetical protein